VISQRRGGEEQQAPAVPGGQEVHRLGAHGSDPQAAEPPAQLRAAAPALHGAEPVPLCSVLAAGLRPSHQPAAQKAPRAKLLPGEASNAAVSLLSSTDASANDGGTKWSTCLLML
jgi:hypothetical protein